MLPPPGSLLWCLLHSQSTQVFLINTLPLSPPCNPLPSTSHSSNFTFTPWLFGDYLPLAFTLLKTRRHSNHGENKDRVGFCYYQSLNTKATTKLNTKVRAWHTKAAQEGPGGWVNPESNPLQFAECHSQIPPILASPLRGRNVAKRLTLLSISKTTLLSCHKPSEVKV